MVLWELTLLTSYFLGLKRTYRLALKAQRYLLKNHPATRQFIQKRARIPFHVAQSAIIEFRRRDMTIGRWLGDAVESGATRWWPWAGQKIHTHREIKAAKRAARSATEQRQNHFQATKSPRPDIRPGGSSSSRFSSSAGPLSRASNHATGATSESCGRLTEKRKSSYALSGLSSLVRRSLLANSSLLASGKFGQRLLPNLGYHASQPGLGIYRPSSIPYSAAVLSSSTYAKLGALRLAAGGVSLVSRGVFRADIARLMAHS